MATNEVYRDADHLVVPVAAGVTAGDPVLVGSLPGVAQTDRDADGNATVWFKGAHDFTVTGAVGAVGDPVYITGAGALDASDGAGANTLFGYALATKGAGDGVITVKIAKV